MRITDEQIAQVKAIPIESVFNWLGFSVRRSGKWLNIKGDDSLKADVLKNKYKDYSTKHGEGSTIDLVMHFQGCDFKTAVEMLASNFLGYVPETAPPQVRKAAATAAAPIAPKQYIAPDLAARYLARYERNNLAVYMANLLQKPINEVAATFAQYRTGTAKNGETAFFYCDRPGRYEYVKVVEYGPNGKRTKKIFAPYKSENGYCRSDLFGAQLLSGQPDKLVLLVESEKTAILAALCFPQVLPLATGGSENLRPDYWAALHGRNVIVLPDADAARQKWRELTATMRTTGINARYLDLCPARDDKSDLADYIAEAMTAANGETDPQWLTRLQEMINSFQCWAHLASEPQPAPEEPQPAPEPQQPSPPPKGTAILTALDMFAQHTDFDLEITGATIHGQQYVAKSGRLVPHFAGQPASEWPDEPPF